LPGALAIAYDGTGHPLGVGIADLDFFPKKRRLRRPLPDRRFARGVYYVRSYALSANTVWSSNWPDGGRPGGRRLGRSFALLNGDSLSQLD
jgi:hypothetical protein